MAEANVELQSSALINYDHDRNLFVGGDSKPIHFCMRPCEERSRIKPLIEYGGGILNNNTTKDCIRLAIKGSIVFIEKSVSSEFIDKCVEKNKLLNFEEFYISTKIENEDVSNEERTKTENKCIQQSTCNRRDYSYNEDMQIVKYICENELYEKVRGNGIWKELENKSIVRGRSWQSMKEHFKKKILIQLNHYKLTAREKLQLLNTQNQPSKKKTKSAPEAIFYDESSSSSNPESSDESDNRRLTSKRVHAPEDEDEGDNSIYTRYKSLRSRRKKAPKSPTTVADADTISKDTEVCQEKIDEASGCESLSKPKKLEVRNKQVSQETIVEASGSESLSKSKKLEVRNKQVSQETIVEASGSESLSKSNKLEVRNKQISQETIVEASESERLSKPKDVEVRNKEQTIGSGDHSQEDFLERKRSEIKSMCMAKFRETGSRMSEEGFSLLLSGMPKKALVAVLKGDSDAQRQTVDDIFKRFPSSSDEDSLESDTDITQMHSKFY